jgi:hypothetical protein
MNGTRIVAGSSLRRAIAALVVVFVTFQPAAAFAIQVLKVSESVMSCCRTKKNCCCRKDGQRGQAPAWKAAAADCERSCSPALATAKPLLFVESNVMPACGILSLAGMVLLPSAQPVSSAYPAFLYQRPPPVLS